MSFPGKCILLVLFAAFSFIAVKSIVFPDEEYKKIEKGNEYILALTPVDEKKIAIHYLNGRVECLNYETGESEILIPGVPEEASEFLCSADSSCRVADKYIICSSYEVIVADKSHNPFSFRKLNTDKIHKGDGWLTLFYIGSRDTVVMTEQNLPNLYIGNIFYCDLKGTDNTFYKLEKKERGKLSKDDYDYLLLLQQEFADKKTDYSTLFSADMVVSKKNGLEVFDLETKKTVRFPNEIHCFGKKINTDELEITEGMMCDDRKNTLLVCMEYPDVPEKYITIWDIGKQKEILSFEIPYLNYLNKGLFQDVIISHCGRYAAVLFEKKKKKYLPDIFDPGRCYFDVWDLEQKKVIHTFFIPGRSYFPLFVWGRNENTIIVRDNDDIEDTLVYDFQKYVTMEKTVSVDDN